MARLGILLVISWLLLPGFRVSAQKEIAKEELLELSRLEDSLSFYADSMNYAMIPEERIGYCMEFARHLKSALALPGSFYYPFKKLEDKIHILYPEDRKFRIINWLVAPSEYLRRYYGVVQPAGKESRYYPMIDYSEKFNKNEETLISGGDQWYGCEYYRIMSYTAQGQSLYLLFGFSSNGMASNKKILDVLSFTPDGPVFGAPVFFVPDASGQRLVQQSRMILEYKKNVQVSLNYDADKKMIMFDRLVSEINDPRRKNTYIPGGQTDGLRWENGRFVYVRDAMPIMKLQDGQAPINGVLGGR